MSQYEDRLEDELDEMRELVKLAFEQGELLERLTDELKRKMDEIRQMLLLRPSKAVDVLPHLRIALDEALRELKDGKK